MLKNLFIPGLIFLLLFSCNEEKTQSENLKNASVPSDTSTPSLSSRLIPIVENMFSPVGMAHAGDERIFFIEQPGRIKIIQNGKLLPKAFLDISENTDIDWGYSEKGLLGIAFHPDYKINGKFYIYYSAKSKIKESDSKTVLAQYNVSSVDSNLASPQGKILLAIEQPESNHNGGQLAFGPDGFLYIGVGDGGGGGDKHGSIGNGQNLASLLGKILRIDVNSGNPYAIPQDNPFVNTPNAVPEIWAYGLRNPWRFSFDRKTGELFCGDVGQNEYEEVDIIEKGKNYGWRAMEGNHVYDEKLVSNQMQAPIHEYPHSIGICVIGGYVYRGKNKEWNGKYIFGDWSNKIYYLEKGTNGWTRKPLFFDMKSAFTINSFGEDNDGEIYVIGQKEVGAKNNSSGVVYKLSFDK